MRVLFIVFLGVFFVACGSQETAEQKAYKEEIYQEDKLAIEEDETLTENPNAIYF